jgi:hypothetical protein
MLDVTTTGEHNMPYTVRVYTNETLATFNDHSFDTLEMAQSQIWGRDESDPYNNDDRPITYVDGVGYDVFDPDGVCVDTHVPSRIGSLKP